MATPVLQLPTNYKSFICKRFVFKNSIFYYGEHKGEINIYNATFQRAWVALMYTGCQPMKFFHVTETTLSTKQGICILLTQFAQDIMKQ